MIKTITIDVINEKAMKLLQDLELLELIRLHKEKSDSDKEPWTDRYKGAMTKQSMTDIENQLNEMRGEWE